MPQTVRDRDAGRYGGDWSKWPVPLPRDIAPADEPWADYAGSRYAPWTARIDYLPVDVGRTTALALHDTPVIMRAGNPPLQGSQGGSSYGFAYDVFKAGDPAQMTSVWDLSRGPIFRWGQPIQWPIDRLPLPHGPGIAVHRQGDPAGSSDEHWRCLDTLRERLYEVILLRRSGLNRFQTFGQCDWVSGYRGGGRGVASWDLTLPWTASTQPTGVVAAQVPQFPMITRWDQIEWGFVDHCGFVSLNNYAPGMEGWARGSDGIDATHPCKAGTMLRLRRGVLDRYVDPHTRTLLRSWNEHGLIVGDKNLSGHASVAMAMDPRIFAAFAGLTLRLTDFEIVQQGAS